jgi:hypothetical protein
VNGIKSNSINFIRNLKNKIKNSTKKVKKSEDQQEVIDYLENKLTSDEETGFVW